MNNHSTPAPLRPEDDSGAGSSRDLVLGRLRAALGDQRPAPAEVPRAYQGPAGAGDAHRLAENLADYHATVHHCSTGGIAAVIDRLLAGRAAVVPPGLPEGWLPPGATVLRDDGHLTHAQIAAKDVVITAAAVAIAATGTIVLDASLDQGRRVLTLLPDVHVCIVHTDQVVASVPDAIARLEPGRPLTWISGPSATSDIELDRVEGVHGPRTLHVLLVT